MDEQDLKARLLKPRLPEAEVEIPGVGTVRVRGLSRSEQLLAVKQGDVDAQGNVNMTRLEAMERRSLVFGMVDPPMTEAEVKEWQRSAPAGELEPIALKIQELSGMLPGAPKEAYKSLRGEPGSGVRVLPGAEAGADGGGAEGDAVG